MTRGAAAASGGRGGDDAPPADLGPRLAREVLAPLKRTFVAKDEVIDLLGVSLAAGENCFLLGPPGTAKSAIVHALAGRLGGRSFEYLLTRFTEPSEVFGPFDIRRLREGDLVTATEGMLPEADFVFLDELLNANSAILNSLLTALNERVFRRGRETRALPALLFVAASNRLPEDETLGALFDRFLVRVRCDAVPGERLPDVLAAGWDLQAGAEEGREGTGRFGVEDVRALRRALVRVDLSDARPRLSDLVLRLREAGILVSDRRAVRLQRLIAASALLAGRTRADASDLWTLRHSWDTDEQREVIAAIVAEAISNAPPSGAPHPRALARERPDPEALLREAESLEGRARAAPPPHERTRLRDRAGALAARVEWVEGPGRAALRERVQGLLRTLDGTP